MWRTIISKDSFISSAVAVLLVSSSLFGGVEAKLVPESIQPGERATLEVRLTETPTSESEAVQVFDDLLTQNKQILVLDRTEAIENETYILRYSLTSYKVGKQTIPPIQIRFGANTVSTESLPVEIQTSRTEEDQELRPEFGKISPPFPWIGFFKLLAIVLLSFGLIYFLREWWQKLPRFTWRIPNRFKKSVPKESSLQWLEAQLKMLKNKMENGDDSDQLVDEWTTILRGYYERTWAKPVTSWTTRECKLRLKSDNSLPSIVPYFEECDHYKFSPITEGSAAELLVRCVTQTERTLLKCGA